METPRIIPNGYLTNHDLVTMFGVTLPCIYKWRRYKGLPFLRVAGYENAPIRYDWPEISEWAKDNNKRIKNDKPLKKLGLHS